MTQLSPRWQQYDDVFRRDAHQIIAWGYQDMRGRLQADSEEDDVTGFLAEAMEDRIYSPNTPERYYKYAVKDQVRVRHSTRTGKHRRLLDIVIWRTGTASPPEFSIEAKILRKNGFPIGEYTGKDGMMLFINGEYARQCPEAAMVAYIQSDDSVRWYSQLQRKFVEDTLNAMCLVTALAESKIIDDLPNEWVSHHQRPDNTTVTIYHIFLDCCV